MTRNAKQKQDYKSSKALKHKNYEATKEEYTADGGFNKLMKDFNKNDQPAYS